MILATFDIQTLIKSSFFDRITSIFLGNVCETTSFKVKKHQTSNLQDVFALIKYVRGGPVLIGLKGNFSDLANYVILIDLHPTNPMGALIHSVF